MKHLLVSVLAIGLFGAVIGFAVSVNTRTEEVFALLEQAITDRDAAISRTGSAIAQTVRAVAQTKEAIALLRKCTEGT